MAIVASILGLGGRGSGLSLTLASKGGVVKLTRDLAIELAPDIPSQLRFARAPSTRRGGRAQPAPTDGAMQQAAGYAILTQNRPLKRVAKPAEIANAILYLASDLASFRNGAIDTVDGGVMAKAG